jgi:uncharacterized membrane protein
MGKAKISISTTTASLVKATIVVTVTIAVTNMIVNRIRPMVDTAIDRAESFREERFGQGDLQDT